MKHIRITGLLLALNATLAGAQTTNVVPVTTTNSAPTLIEPAEVEGWSFSAAAYAFLVPDSRDYVQPTFTADRGWAHLEARYNYEDLETGSVWVGYNFSIGEKLAFEGTPMLGGVFGNTTGIAPGYKFSLSYWKVELYSEGEYVIDPGDSSENFFYTWTELSLSPVDWFRFGLVAQRTRAYQTDLDIQRGFLLGFTYKQVDFTAYLFNPDEDEPTLALAVTVSF